MKLEFEESPLQIRCSRFEIPKNQSLIQEEVNKCLKKGVVVECEHYPVEFILLIPSKVYKTNEASLSNAKNAKIYSCNIHQGHNYCRSKL